MRIRSPYFSHIFLPQRCRNYRKHCTVMTAHLDQVQYPELALRAIDDEHEVERRIAPVHDAKLLTVTTLRGLEECLELGGVEEVAEARGPRGHERIDLLDEGLL